MSLFNFDPTFVIARAEVSYIMSTNIFFIIIFNDLNRRKLSTFIDVSL